MAIFTVATSEFVVIGGIAAIVAILFLLILTREKQPTVTVTKVIIYPIKSCKGTELTTSNLCITGFDHDRQWLVVDEKDGSFMHQRKESRMALIHPKVQADGGLVISAPGKPDITVPLIKASDQGAKLTQSRVWDDQIQQTVDQGDQVAAWLSDYLKRPVRLVHFDQICKRTSPQQYLVSRSANRVAFNDAFSFLVVSEESIADYRRQAGPEGDSITYRNFRPNILVKGAKPWAEDRWQELVINDVWFYGPKRCTRCKMTTVNPDTGSPGDIALEPLKTLSKFRKVGPESILFGLNLVHCFKPNRGQKVTVGDRLYVQRTGPIPPFK